MNQSAEKLPVGRPRVTIKPQIVWELRNRGTSWRTIAKLLKIGTATAIRLFRSAESTRPRTLVPLTRGTPAVTWLVEHKGPQSSGNTN
jgi:hypothetical protein